MAVTPPNPFSPEAIAHHKARREAQQNSTPLQAVAVELHAGSPADQVDALLSEWLEDSPETFSEGLAALSALLEDYAGSLKAAPEAVGMEGAYRAYVAGKELEGAGKRLADAVKARLIVLADPDGAAKETRRTVTTPSGATFKVGPGPNPERVKVKDLRSKYPDLAEELRDAGIIYKTPPSLAVYLPRTGTKKTPTHPEDQ